VYCSGIRYGYWLGAGGFAAAATAFLVFDIWQIRHVLSEDPYNMKLSCVVSKPPLDNNVRYVAI
jgi:hypothetical protein